MRNGSACASLGRLPTEHEGKTAMENSFIYKTDRPWPNSRLKRAAIVGHTTASSTRLWLRIAAPGDYTLLLYPAAADANEAVHAGFKAVPYAALDQLPAFVRRIGFRIDDYSRDATIVLDLDDLQPLTEYRYAVYGEEDGKHRILLGQDRPYRFRTMPAQAAPLSFAFYSCHLPFQENLFGSTRIVNMEMWDCLNEVMARHYDEDLRFAVAGGDQVYADGVPTLDIWKYLNKTMRKEAGKLLPTQEEMVSWYRDIYRGYWGFPAVQKAYSSYPTYMIWDDHELKDGWGSDILKDRGSDELDEIFPTRKKNKLSRADCRALLTRMRQAALQVYEEYQHAHNPPTPAGQYDYSMLHGCSGFYVLDGRGQRDINRQGSRILGEAQLRRFIDWLQARDPAVTPYVFVVSAVPLLHMKTAWVNDDSNAAFDLADLQDDLRDAWEHELHDAERRAVLAALFGAAARGLKVCILSGDVHTSAVFRMTDPASKAVIYQLTSSAITYHKSRLLGWLLGNTVPDHGESDDGYAFERLALYTDSNFALLRVDPEADEVVFQLYGLQQVTHPQDANATLPVTHAIAKFKLAF